MSLSWTGQSRDAEVSEGETDGQSAAPLRLVLDGSVFLRTKTCAAHCPAPHTKPEMMHAHSSLRALSARQDPMECGIEHILVDTRWH